MARICFLNPFGTDAYDALVEATLTPSLRGTTEVEIRHLQHAPRNIDFFAGKHLVETEIMKAAIEAEQDGFDAFVIGCCYDPALSQCRELVDIPVIGPMEASVLLSRLFGHSFAIVTDHYKAVPELRDMVRRYGVEPNCRAIDAIDWQIESVVADPAGCAQATYDRVLEVVARSGAETVALGCTIVAASYELALMNGEATLGEISVINPNAVAVKVAEMFADLSATKQYRISRVGYYQRHEAFDPAEAAEIRGLLTDRPPTKAVATGSPVS